MRKHFGEDVPTFDQLRKSIKMMFINEHPLWADNHPVPPNIIYMGGVHIPPVKELPKDLKQYLDSSKHGVIYISFGTNVLPSLLPPEKIQVMTKVLAQLPYDVLWKWDKDVLPEHPNNIKFSKWFPQADLLKHPNVKLFITQGGLQSTDEAIDAAVPLIGIPMLGDQWYNVEKYTYHKMGMQLDITTLTENEFKNAINTVIQDKSYKNNMSRLRGVMREYPIDPLNLTVWWIEHVIKYGGDHLTGPAADMSWIEYYEVKLVLIVLNKTLKIMADLQKLFLLFLLKFAGLEAARILAFFPTPSISHQIVFRPITKELAKRGHEIIVVTPDPAYSKYDTPQNFTEIDTHDISYKEWEKLLIFHRGRKDDFIFHIKMLLKTFANVLDKQMELPELKEIIDKDRKYFDLILLEACNRPLLGIVHKFDAPVIQLSSLGTIAIQYHNMGAPVHPILYPTPGRQRLYNLTLVERSIVIITHLLLDFLISDTEEYDYAVMRKHFGKDVPTFEQLRKSIKMMFLNEHPFWADNHPVPPNIIYMGGIYLPEVKELPKDIKQYLHSSKHGVIYVSFGTNVLPSLLPPNKIKIMTNVLSQLPYNVLWKWDSDELPAKSNNIKFSKWFPQADLLKHPNVKLFITQGGLQSTDEAIDAAVPVIGIPMLGDQWYNVEKYTYHKIGMQLDITTLTENELKNAINTLINDKSYKTNMLKLRAVMREYPINPLNLTVWWIEHVIKYGGDHLTAPAANMSWVEYYEVKLGPQSRSSMAIVFTIVRLEI
ncbi:UDP-glycosyltransferase UGT33J1 [Danaus plexippus plexippus]|uniref:UDP-glycosyltransferase UGT33J1 n=1 Tax=Danaus plexippus plexippus TaxID=278856 RepID=A0A212F6X6_DANPL|nr:UDP-glycosyltransferase UGT33J1 [Danaus plexippus plexippus]